MSAQLDLEDDKATWKPSLKLVFPSVMIVSICSLVFNITQRPQPAVALPTFAQAYQVDCSMCHTMVPALNAYGRYVQSTAFGALDPTVMHRAIPIVIRESVSYRSTGKLDARQPNDRYTYENLSVNLVGVLNKYVSYRAEQTLYSNNLGGGNTGHLWVSYNQLLKGDGHFIVGKFDLPAPPAFSYWQDQSGFSSPSIGVGQHGYNLAGDRWGLGFNYVPTNYQKMPYKAQFSYVGNSPSMFNAYAFSNSNPYAPGGAGSDRAFQYKFAYARPDKPVEAGVYGDVGSYILTPGYRDPVDDYNALGVYAQRDPVKSFPGLLMFYQQTSDSNVGPGGAAQHLEQSATNRAFAFELDEPALKGDVMIALRPVEYLDGLQASKNGLDVLTTAKPHYGTYDIIARDPKISPYLYLTLESAVPAASNAANGLPTWRAGLKWAGPLFRPQALAAAPPSPSAQNATTDSAASSGAAVSPSPSVQNTTTGGASPPALSSEDLQAGKQIYAMNCAACHNADGTGGVGPSLHQLWKNTSLSQTITFIEKPSGMMPKLYPGTLSETQVGQVAAYIRATFH